MNTERTEKFVNAIACDLEEGGFRQVSGTMLRRTLATAVSAALPLLPPAELAEQQVVDGVEEAGRAIESSLAARQLGAVPTGWKLVPELASEEQLRAVLDTGVYHDGEDSARAVLADEYRTMVAAAPSASPSQGIDLGQFRPAVLTAIGFTGPNDHERKHLRSLLDLIDDQRDAAPGVG